MVQQNLNSDVSPALSPYIIGTSNQPLKMTANHGLHLSFRFVKGVVLGAFIPPVMCVVCVMVENVLITLRLRLHWRFHHLRMVTFSNNVEPANGFLVRYLHRKLMESEDERSLTNEDLIRVLDWVPKLWYHLHTFLEKHSTSDFLIGMKHTGQGATQGPEYIPAGFFWWNFFSQSMSFMFFFSLFSASSSGPCFFLSCPVTVDEFRSWFIDLWNHSIIPYLQEGAKDGIKVREEAHKSRKWSSQHSVLPLQVLVVPLTGSVGNVRSNVSVTVVLWCFRSTARKLYGRTRWSGWGAPFLGRLPSRTRPSCSICLPPASAPAAPVSPSRRGLTRRPRPAPWNLIHW